MTRKNAFQRLLEEVDKKKQTLVVIDTEDGFLDRFDKKLRDQRLKKDYQLFPYSPDTTLPPDQLITECLSEINRIIGDGLHVWGILIDIVIVESRRGLLDKTGVAIANEVKKTFPDIPVFNITTKFEDDEEIAMVSEATVENNDGILFKDYLEGKYCSAESLKALISKAKSKSCNTIAADARLYEKRWPGLFGQSEAIYK